MKLFISLSSGRADKVNIELGRISKKYWPSIPLEDLFDACRKHGLTPVDSSGKPWQGFLTGKSGRVSIDLKGIENTTLNIQWYKMPSGKWEVNAYI